MSGVKKKYFEGEKRKETEVSGPIEKLHVPVTERKWEENWEEREDLV